MNSVGWTWGMQGGDDANPNTSDRVLLYLLSPLSGLWVCCFFAISTTTWIADRPDGTCCAALPIPGVPVCRSAAGSWLFSPRNKLLCLFYLWREHWDAETALSESPSWAHTVSAVWIGSLGVCRSAEPQQEGYFAGVSVQSVRLWFHFLRIFVISE